jgi:calreticulin
MKRTLLLFLLTLASAKVYFKETFDSSWQDRWVVSDWKKSSGEAGAFAVRAGDWYADPEKDKGLATTQDARFYAASAKFPKSFSNEGKDLVLQFSVKFPQNIDCGGGYLKLLPSTVDQAHFGGDSTYNIMFGPDVCGHTKRTHVIFHYPKKGENLLIKKEIRPETDQLTHVYTLIVHPDNTYEVRIDGVKKESGNLKDDWDFLPAEKIKDPSISKPHDWVDDAMIDDPNDKKPSDWDNVPKSIPDPEAEKPEDWDDDADGEWEAPLIDNPEYKGDWKPKRIANPGYQGPWVHPEIPNPDYTEDPNLYRYSDIGAIGIDIWQVKSGTIFDNILISDSVSEAEDFLAETYTAGKDAEKTMFDEIQKKKRDEEESSRKKAEEERKGAAESHEADEDEDGDGEEHDEL